MTQHLAEQLGRAVEREWPAERNAPLPSPYAYRPSAHDIAAALGTTPGAITAPNAIFADLPFVAAGIGDITSTDKGSGARFNAGKPDLSLIPLTLLAEHYLRLEPDNTAAGLLRLLGAYQETHDRSFLYEVLDRIGSEGWHDCAQVFAYGKAKYAAWNWAKGMAWSAPLACAARHLVAMIGGEDSDPESGWPHRGHVFCNLVMLLQYTKTYTEGNDLPPKGLL